MPPDAPCTSLATHRWSQGSSLMLTLPDCDGRYDIVRQWQCQRCGLPVWAVGTIDTRTPPISPLLWEESAHDHQSEGSDIYGQEDARQERLGRQAQRFIQYTLGRGRKGR